MTDNPLDQLTPWQRQLLDQIARSGRDSTLVSLPRRHTPLPVDRTLVQHPTKKPITRRGNKSDYVILDEVRWSDD